MAIKIAAEWHAAVNRPHRESFTLLMSEGNIYRSPSAWITRRKTGPAAGLLTSVDGPLALNDEYPKRLVIPVIVAATGLTLDMQQLVWLSQKTLGNADTCFFVAILPPGCKPKDTLPDLEPWRFVETEKLRHQPSHQGLLWMLEVIKPKEIKMEIKGGSDATNKKD